MKQVHISLLVATVFTLMFCCASSLRAERHKGPGPYLIYGPNMCPDPSFENAEGESFKAFLDSTKARSGSNALKVSLTKEQVERKERCTAALTPIVVESQSLYRVAVWIHIADEIITANAKRSRYNKPNTLSWCGAYLQAELLDESKNPIGAALMGKPQLDLSHETFGSWVQLRGLIKTNRDTRFLKLQLGLDQDIGTAWFDDLSLNKIDNDNDWLCFFESREERDKRIGWWKESGYGMFPIFGIYSIHAGEWKGRYWPNRLAEWLTHRADVPHGELKALAEVFRPHKFDAEEYVRLAKEAGMGHIVITAKYHDGFAMWPTTCDRFNIKDCSGFERDILMELKTACKKAGIHLGFYYSQAQEWYTPGGFDIRYSMFGNKDGSGEGRIVKGMREVDVAPFELTRNYLENKSKPQLEELMKRYDPDVIWFDVPTEINIIDSLELLAIMRKYNPRCLAGSRLHSSGQLKDFRTLDDYQVPKEEIDDDYWESLPGMQKHTYSYDQFQPFRSPEEIFEELRSVRAKGGNYLLAIGGPKGDGSIPEINFEILRKVKEMIDKQGGLPDAPIKSK